MSLRRGYLLIALAFASTVANATAAGQTPEQETDYIYYRPNIDFGSESVQGPLNTLMNRGLSNLFYGSSMRDVFDLAWGERFDAVWHIMGHPLEAIDNVGGWGKFIQREFLIASPSVWEWSWTSNYVGHIVGGGLSYRYLREWLDFRGAPLPAVGAMTIVFGANLVNEAIEWPLQPKAQANSMADMYFFEPLGFFLMSHDGIARFFIETLGAADWSPQASLTLPAGRIQNVGQIMSYKVPLPWMGETRGLVVIGLVVQAGLIRPIGGDYHLGVTFGFNGRGRTIDPDTGLERFEADLASGIYLDRDNSLLASVILSEQAYSHIQVNVYPGVLPGHFRHIGAWLALNQDSFWSVGISTRRTLGLGFGYDFGDPGIR